MLFSWLLLLTFSGAVRAQDAPKPAPSWADAVSAAADEYAASARVLALEVPAAAISESATTRPARAAQPTAPASLPDTLPLAAAEASAAIAAAATESSALAENVALDELMLQAKGTQSPPGCWQDGYTPELCCRDNPVANCWDAVFTRQRCCPAHAKPSEIGAPQLSAEVAAVVAAAAARNVQGSEFVEAKEPKDLSQASTMSETSEQQVFLQQEAQRRWPAYFSRAHETLNAAQGPSPLESPSNRPDPVQLYHLLYETVNQVVAGLSLAADATPSEELKAAFQNAAVLLARLALASRGTPLEHEDFGSQANAAIALGCKDPQNPQCNLSESLRRLQMPLEAGTGWLQEALHQLNASAADSAEHLQRFQRTWLKYSQSPAKALWRPAGAVSVKH